MSFSIQMLECHALLCDSVVTARKLALSMALAFKEYARTLQGKPYKFKVDLRAPAEVEKDLKEDDKPESAEEEDCEAWWNKWFKGVKMVGRIHCSSLMNFMRWIELRKTDKMLKLLELKK